MTTLKEFQTIYMARGELPYNLPDLTDLTFEYASFKRILDSDLLSGESKANLEKATETLKKAIERKVIESSFRGNMDKGLYDSALYCAKQLGANWLRNERDRLVVEELQSDRVDENPRINELRVMITLVEFYTA